MLNVYKNECEGSSKKTIQRRWTVIFNRYISLNRKTTEELSEELILDQRVIQDDQKKAIEDLSLLFFGIGPLLNNFK